MEAPCSPAFGRTVPCSRRPSDLEGTWHFSPSHRAQDCPSSQEEGEACPNQDPWQQEVVDG